MYVYGFGTYTADLPITINPDDENKEYTAAAIEELGGSTQRIELDGGEVILGFDCVFTHEGLIRETAATGGLKIITLGLPTEQTPEQPTP